MEGDQVAEDASRDRAALCQASELIHDLMVRRLVSDDEAVAEIGTAMHGYRGTPVTEDCPVRCLGLTARSYNAVMRGYRDPDERPTTVGDMIRLLYEDRLRDFRNVGPRVIGELEARLVFAGLDIRSHRH
jgi:hypothetical protein